MRSLGFLWLRCCFSVLLWLPFLKQGLTTTLTCCSTPLFSWLLLPFLGRETTDPCCSKLLLPPGSPGKYPGLVPYLCPASFRVQIFPLPNLGKWSVPLHPVASEIPRYMLPFGTSPLPPFHFPRKDQIRCNLAKALGLHNMCRVQVRNEKREMSFKICPFPRCDGGPIQS